MASAKLEGSMTTEELQGKLLKTKQFSHNAEMNTYLINLIKSEGKNISLPTNGFFASISPSYKQELLDLYNGTFGLYEGINSIPDDVKVSQAALLDSLHYGYVVAEEKVEMYTMNPGIFFSDMAILPEKILSSIFEKNKVGLLKCYRVDFEYDQNNENLVKYKLVNHRRDIDDEEYVMLVPYLVGVRLMQIIKSFLDKDFVLKTNQIIAGGDKVRCITLSQKFLKKYCDEESAVEGLEAKYFPLKAFFYAPVLGAPSITSMVTNINIFQLDELKRVSTIRQIQQMGIQKPKDPIESAISESVVRSSLLNLKRCNPDEYLRVIEKLPRLDEILPDVFPEDISAPQISMYLHTIKNDEMKKVLKAIPDAEKTVASRKELFVTCRKATPEELKDIRGLVRNHLCRFLIQKKDFNLSTITGTNSPSILKSIYGENYFNNYESVGVKFNAASRMVEEQGCSYESALKFYGFDETTGVDLKVVTSEAANEIANNPNMKEEDAYKSALYRVMGKRQRKGSSDNSIMIRTMDAYYSGDGIEVDGYYRNIDPAKIKQVYVLM